MSKIVWIDMEMSGLDVRKDKIMEIACLITDNNLEVVAEHETIVVHQPDSVLEAMNEWCQTTHTKVAYINRKRKRKSFFIYILIISFTCSIDWTSGRVQKFQNI